VRERFPDPPALRDARRRDLLGGKRILTPCPLIPLDSNCCAERYSVRPLMLPREVKNYECRASHRRPELHYRLTISKPSTRSKCSSDVAKGKAFCTHNAAIQTSFSGIGVPACLSCRRTQE